MIRFVSVEAFEIRLGSHSFCAGDDNNVHRTFMEKVLDWHPQFVATGADGFFRIAIRRNPSAVCWSWALEWNHNLRVVGFFGEREPLETLLQDVPMTTVVDNPNERIAFREEKVLDEKDDKLFSLKAEAV